MVHFQASTYTARTRLITVVSCQQLLLRSTLQHFYVGWDWMKVSWTWFFQILQTFLTAISTFSHKN